MKHWMQLFLVCSVIVPWAGADQPMEKTDILLLLEQLCRQPTASWINQGRIEAIHHSSDTITNQTTETLETVTTDGNRFTWHIRINSDNNKSKMQYSKEFLQWNQERFFIWDGQLYTLYFRPGNQAIVYEDTSVPVHVTGPWTAGCVPWGYGIFTLRNLASASLSAKIVQTNDGLQTHLSVKITDHPQMEFVLDPSRDNAVLSYTLLKSDDSKVVQAYGAFKKQLGRWIPMNILIDHYDENQLKSSDAWEIISIQDTVPESENFTTNFQEKALVQYHTPLLENPVFYRHSSTQSIKPLMEKHLVAALKKEQRKQNCGTVAIEKTLSDFGVSVTDLELEMLVRADSGDTSLYQLRQFIQQKGLFCLPVKTNIAGLERFKDAQVLLHFPHKKHFVLLDRIENSTIWIIDLDRQTFYHCMDTDQFKNEWAGIALVVSRVPLFIQDMERPVPDPVLKNITGSADYSCSDLIQEYDVAFCPEMVMGTCGGRYEVWYQRYGCQKDSNGGYCGGTGVIGSVYSNCIEDMYDPSQCFPTGNYSGRYMRACQP